MNRRQVLKMGAAGVAAALCTNSPLAFAKRADESADVVVIGSGGTGFTAAITAFDAGVKVIVLEKMPITGGNTQLSAGGMNSADTVVQKQKNIEDNWKIMYEDTMKGGKNISDPKLVEVHAKNSADAINFLLDLGADMTDVGRLGGSSVNRSHRPTGGEAVGHNLIHTMRQNALKRKMDVRTNSRALKILSDDQNRITGVVVEDSLGRGYVINTPTVILASGGFSANLKRVAEYRPEYASFSSTNQPGATGDGLDLAVALGAKLRDMEQIQIHPTQAAGSKILITEAVRGNGAIAVNREGKRFMNEMTTRDAASAAVLQQTGKTAFLIFDETIRRSLKQIEGYFHLELVKEGNTPQELGAACGINGDELAKTIESYNKIQASKNDTEWQRTDMPRPIKDPKFFAIEVRPGIHYTMGGVVINEKTQVIGKDNKPIPGLFAGGEVTGGVHGANRLGGNSISETIVFGRIAGAEAVAYVKENATKG